MERVCQSRPSEAPAADAPAVTADGRNHSPSGKDGGREVDYYSIGGAPALAVDRFSTTTELIIEDAVCREVEEMAPITEDGCLALGGLSKCRKS